MDRERSQPVLQRIINRRPDKCPPLEKIFGRLRRSDRIFIGTGCGEPRHLIDELAAYLRSHPKAVTDAELFQVWTLGVAPYTEKRFQDNVRHCSFFIGPHTRRAVNEGLADYTPIFLSEVPELLRSGHQPLDAALIQVSPPDEHGFCSLGISVDIVLAACEAAQLVIAQVNPRMPRVHGDGFIHLDELDYLVPHEEELYEYTAAAPPEIARRIGRYVAELIADGDTLQVGYGSLPNAVLEALGGHRHLGVHTELFSDGLVDLLECGAVDNSRKSLDRGKSVAAFCMGRRRTYEFIDDNPGVEFHGVDYTNAHTVIARQRRMTAVNSALEIDLTGQASAESLGERFYSGLGGQADFMRGAVLAPGGKTILALRSTAGAGEGRVSRIVPFLRSGAGVTLGRGDAHYVVTEYGVAYLHGKNIRERAMDLIAIAHPDFRPALIEEARRRRLIYPDQVFVPGDYPEHLEVVRTTEHGLTLRLRPVRLSDEPQLKSFIHQLSDHSLYRRFMSTRTAWPHRRLQRFCAVDYDNEMLLLAVLPPEPHPEREEVVGCAEFYQLAGGTEAEVAFAVADAYHNRGVATELLRLLELIAKKRGLTGFRAEVLRENTAVLHLFEKLGYRIEKRAAEDSWVLRLGFAED